MMNNKSKKKYRVVTSAFHVLRKNKCALEQSPPRPRSPSPYSKQMDKIDKVEHSGAAGILKAPVVNGHPWHNLPYFYIPFALNTVSTPIPTSLSTVLVIHSIRRNRRLMALPTILRLLIHQPSKLILQKIKIPINRIV